MLNVKLTVGVKEAFMGKIIPFNKEDRLGRKDHNEEVIFHHFDELKRQGLKSVLLRLKKAQKNED